jgi:hypothetical protein
MVEREHSKRIGARGEREDARAQQHDAGDQQAGSDRRQAASTRHDPLYRTLHPGHETGTRLWTHIFFQNRSLERGAITFDSLMLEPEHCSPRSVVALAVPGAATATSAATETVHARIRRRREKDVIS